MRRNRSKIALAALILCVIAGIALLVFLPRTVAVRFDLNYEDAGKAPAVQRVKRGEYAAEPETPERENYIFVGWFTEEEPEYLFSSYEFESTPVNEKLTLYAVWRLDARVFTELNTATMQDSDGDGLSDEYEEKIGTDKSKADTDGDGVDDHSEIVFLNTDPLSADSDSDGVYDGDEDADGDGLANAKEQSIGTALMLADTDNDGLGDGEELILGLDPLKADTDGDGASDGYELDNGTDAAAANASFTETADAFADGENGGIFVSVEATVKGEIAGTVSVKPMSLLEFPAMSKTIPGYMGSAFELSADGAIEHARLTFEYGAELGKIGEDFQPRIYYYNEETHEYEELPDQTVAEGIITVEIEHFSYYAVMNSAEFDSYSGLPEKYAPKKASSTKLEDYYDAIYYGLMPTTDGRYPFVGFDLKSDSDFDGDGLKNSDEIEIVFNKKGLPVVYVHSNPLLPDTDFDGILDSEDDYPENYSLRSAQDVRALLDASKYDSTYVYHNIYIGGDTLGKQLVAEYKRNWNEAFSMLGYFDYGTQKQVFMQTWLEYLSAFCDFSVEQAKADEYRMLYASCVSGFLEDTVTATMNYLEGTGAIDDLISGSAEVSLVVLNKEYTKLIQKGFYDWSSDAFVGLNSTLDCVLWVKSLSESIAIVDNFMLGFEIGTEIGETANTKENFEKTVEAIAENNANVEVYASCIAMLERIAMRGEDPAATSAAKELIAVLREGAESYDAFCSELKSSENTRSLSQIAYTVAKQILNTKPIAKMILLLVEEYNEYYASIANAQNKVIADVMMANAADELVTPKLVDMGDGIVLADPEEAVSVYNLLGHLWGLRLNGERLYAELWDGQAYLKNIASVMAKRADSIGLNKSETLLQLCYQVSEPNMVIEVTADDGIPILGDKNFKCGVFVDGVQLIYVNRNDNELRIYLEPGESHKVKIVVLGKDGVYYAKEQSLISQAGKVLRGEFVIHMKADSSNKFKVIDKDTELLVEAVVIFRSGKDNFYDVDCMHTVFNAPNKRTQFQDLDIPAGEYCVEVIANGYSSYYNNIIAEDKKKGEFVFELSALETAVVKGKINGPDGKAVSGAAIDLVDVEGAVLASTESSADGAFAFNVPLDKLASYYAVCSAAGYTPQKHKVYANKSDPAFENIIVMTPVVPPSAVIAEGNVNNGIKWYVFADGTLSLSGSGSMPRYGRNGAKDQPWAAHFDSIKKIIVGEGITGLGEYAFAHCTNLKEVILPSTLLDLGCGTFAFCTRLTELEIPDPVKEMGWDVFYGCRGLKNVKLSKKLSVISANAFYGCTSLRALEIPASVKSIDIRSFCGCTALRTLRFKGRAPAVDAKAFEGTGGRTVLGFISGMPGWTYPTWTSNGVEYRTSPYSLAPNADGSMHGSGTAEDPYQVCTAKHLDMVRNDLKAHYLQMNDIDLSGFENFLPIGKGVPGGATTGKTKNYDYGGAWFEGSYDGNGFKISGLKIYQTELDCVGLFSGTSEKAVLRNINIENASVKVDKASTDYYAFYKKYELEFYTYAGILVGKSGGNIENCTVSGELEVKNGCTVYAGGIAGLSYNIDSCDNYATVYAMANRGSRSNNVAGDVTCGGIVGRTATVYSTTIKHCRNYGSVTAAAGYNVSVAGICGHLGYLLECINYGDVTAKYDIETASWKTEAYVGGISGDLQNANVNGCINSGNVLAECYVSGSDASGSNNFILHLGGIAGKVGFYGGGILSNCVNGCREIAYRVIDKTDEDGNVIEYKLQKGIYRITEFNGRAENFRYNYSVADTLVNGEPATEMTAENAYNGGNITKEEFDRRLAELVAKIEG
ncbi:MAG: leucine-rich repeat protein [Clostridia bacterium]|nr:leucine-rich repeat protein [Clostridia bacterium]